MASNATGYLGISQPISFLEATKYEVELTTELISYLNAKEQIDTEEGWRYRHDLLERLNVLVQKWIIEFVKKLIWFIFQTQEAYENVPIGKILAFGGQQMGIVNRKSDIDAVCIVPYVVERNEFFISFLKILQNAGDINNIKTIEHAAVPIIKFTCGHLEVDLCMARLSDNMLVDDISLSDNTIFMNMDPVSARSLNGVRECLAIQQLVPDIKKLRTAVTAIKFWAKVNGLYGSVFGFPTGIGYTIMMARVCQLYPNAPPAVLIQKFFILFANWRWPTPVVLKELSGENPFDFPTWNPQINPSDSYHQMPVITPAYPQRNANFTVTKSARKLLSRQMQTDNEKMKNILSGAVSWNELFSATAPFLKTYKHFLVVIAESTQECHLQAWVGLVESRLRVLVDILDKQPAIEMVHAWPKSISERQNKWFLGLQLIRSSEVTLDITTAIEEFNKSVNKLGVERNIFQSGMKICITHTKRKELLVNFPTGDIT